MLYWLLRAQHLAVREREGEGRGMSRKKGGREGGRERESRIMIAYGERQKVNR
jgi:hypothetical protein